MYERTTTGRRRNVIKAIIMGTRATKTSLADLLWVSRCGSGPISSAVLSMKLAE